VPLAPSGHYTEGVPFAGTPWRVFAAVVLGAALFYFGDFTALGGVGLLGPDEPRYAAIGQAMAASGDWVTPRLWGEPWFEKPPLLYWLAGLGFRSGLGPDVAPRLPVILLSGAFLILYWWILRRLFSPQVAWSSACLLATCCGWAALSQIAVTDLPLAATFSAGMLLAWYGLEREDRAALAAAGVCFGLAVLAKGLVPLVLALPLAIGAWRRWRDFVVPVALGLLVATPWYARMIALYGRPFVDDFFGKHHFARFATGALMHRQPWWFFVPVLLAALFPWTPLVCLFRKSVFSSRDARYLGAWVGFGLIFFSLSANKLPGYVLPLLPAAIALIALALEERRPTPGWLAACILLLAGVPAIGAILPQALSSGLSRASFGSVSFGSALVVVPAAAVVWLAERYGNHRAAIGGGALCVAIAIACLKVNVFPVLDRTVSARGLYRDLVKAGEPACIETLHRSVRYGLNFYTNYYSGSLVPGCDQASLPLRVRQPDRQLPEIVR
jgi:4-amino-4-deoxy-L-arabinose transferase-like glycosyltransferase